MLFHHKNKHSKPCHLPKKLYFSLKNIFKIYLKYIKLCDFKEESKDPVLQLTAHISPYVFKQTYDFLGLPKNVTYIHLRAVTRVKEVILFIFQISCLIVDYIFQTFERKPAKASMLTS